MQDKEFLFGTLQNYRVYTLIHEPNNFILNKIIDYTIMIIDFNNYLNYKIFKYQVIYILKFVSIYIISKSIVCIITMLLLN